MSTLAQPTGGMEFLSTGASSNRTFEQEALMQIAGTATLVKRPNPEES